MADPISIIGTAGALANIIQLTTQTITAIRELQTDWKDADLAFLTLTGQLSSLRLALTKIEEWVALEAGAHYQLVMDLDDSIRCCNILLAKLQELVDSLRQKHNGTLNFQSKIKLVFGKKSVDDVQKLLEHQTSALNLLLAACNCKTSTEQKVLLERSSSQKVLRQPNLDSASLMVQYDTNSIASQMTDTLSRLSLNFSFDRALFTSGVYERSFRGLIKKPQGVSQARAPAIDQPRRMDSSRKMSHQKLLFIGSEYSGLGSILHDIVDVKNPPFDIHLKLEQMAAYRFVILSMKAIVTALSTLGNNFQSDINMDTAVFMKEYTDDMTVTPAELVDVRVVEAVRSLWQDPCMERVRQSPKDFGMAEPAVHLLDELDRVCSPDYTPTDKDKQSLNNKTPAAVEVHFTSDNLRTGEITSFEIRDITLRLPSNRPYNFEDLAFVILQTNLTSHDGMSRSLMQGALLDSISGLKTMLQSAWVPTNNVPVMLLSSPDDFDTRVVFKPFPEFYLQYVVENGAETVHASLEMELYDLLQFAALTSTLGRLSKKTPGMSYLENLIVTCQDLPRLHINSTGRRPCIVM